MESKITVEVRLQERIFVLAAVHGVHGLHTSVETDNQVVQVETDSQSIGHRQLLVEAVEAERAFLLPFIVADIPDVARIHEDSPIEFPEQVGAVFHIQIELDVARMIDVVHAIGTSLVASWT